MKLLYTFLISFLLINFNNTSAQTIEVDIEPLLKYIDDAQKCTDSIKYMPNFKEKVGHEVWLEIMDKSILAQSFFGITLSILSPIPPPVIFAHPLINFLSSKFIISLT